MIDRDKKRLPCPLELARSELTALKIRVAWAMALPWVVAASALVVVWAFDHGFLRNPILVTVLGLFLLGQVFLVGQLRRLLRRASSGLKVLVVLMDSGDRPDLPILERKLQALSPDPLRDLVLGWIGLGRDFGGEGASEFLQNSIDRRVLGDDADLGIHGLINRVVLKVGFLGTLIGLLLTFPPMKRAVLGLSGSGGEMTFIRDIAKAIDEDAYAIQATLVATGFSLLLETLVVHIVERFYGRFELVESHLSDWNLTVLRRATTHRAEPSHGEISEDNLRLKEKLAQGQQILDAHLARLIDSLETTGKSVEAVARTQDALHRRVTELADWEEEYRQFLAAKSAATLPASGKAKV